MSVVPSRWPSDALRQFVTQLQQDSTECSHPPLKQLCSGHDLNNLARDIELLSPEILHERFPEYALKLYEILYRVSCQKAFLCYQPQIAAFNIQPIDACLSFRELFSSVQDLSKYSLNDESVRQAKIRHLVAIRTGYVNIAGSVQIKDKKVHYLMNWAQGLVVTCSLTGSVSAPKSVMRSEISLLHYSYLLHQLFKRGFQEESNAHLPGPGTIAGVSLVSQVVFGAAATAAVGTATVVGAVYWLIKNRVGLTRSQPENIQFTELSSNVAIGFDKSCGYGNRAMRLASRTWGYLRITLQNEMRYFYPFHYGSATEPQAPIDPAHLISIHELLYYAFCENLISLEEIVSIHSILQKPIEGCVNNSKGLLDEWTAIFIESLIPVCLEQVIKKNTDIVQMMIDRCGPDGKTAIPLKDFLAKIETEDNLGFGHLALVQDDAP